MEGKKWGRGSLFCTPVVAWRCFGHASTSTSSHGRVRLSRAEPRGGTKYDFEKVADYAAFEQALEEARRRVEMRLLDYELMPNHWHLVVWPREDGDLSDYLGWLTSTHMRRWHLAHGTVGTGPLYQGRFKSFPVQEDEHF